MYQIHLGNHYESFFWFVSWVADSFAPYGAMNSGSLIINNDIIDNINNDIINIDIKVPDLTGISADTLRNFNSYEYDGNEKV